MIIGKVYLHCGRGHDVKRETKVKAATLAGSTAKDRREACGI